MMRHTMGIVGILLAALTATTNHCLAFESRPDETVIVIPKPANAVVEAAARELQSHVEKATGTRIPVLTEGSVPHAATKRICIGSTKSAVDAGISTSTLERDAYRIKTTRDLVFLLGADGDGDPMNLGTPAGTLFAVYDVLDNDLGVRWLWPGESGMVVPKRSTLKIRDRDKTVRPRFKFCGLRTGRPEEIRWMRRMRMHDADRISYGHAFEKWGEKYFADHPDWFEMDTTGVRHAGKSMCVSNPGFHKQIVENWWATEQTRPAGARRNLNICENDCPGACNCPNCLAWDGPSPPWPRPTPYDIVHNVSQRYARFEMAVLELARKHDPDIEVTAYAYTNLTFAPTGVIMDKRVLVGYVPDVFFPRTTEQHEWVHRQWTGWVNAGASMFLRPNYLLHGYCMPVNWTRQMADDFQFFARNGMIGTDYDSLTGMWSTMGLPLYVLGRLHVNPESPADEIMEEYYAAFGPAAKRVKAYWEYWERYSFDHMEVFKDGLWHYARYPESAAKRFPPESFAPAEKLMAEAEEAAAKDRDAAAKVAFLKTGLQHARLCVEASVALEKAGKDEVKRKAAVEQLYAFRNTIKDPMVVNVADGDSSCRGLEKNLGWPE